MVKLIVKILDKEDKPYKFPGVPEDKILDGIETTAVIIEEGTYEKKPSILIQIKDAKGNVMYSQITSGLLRSLVQALDGAEAKWAEKKG